MCLAEKSGNAVDKAAAAVVRSPGEAEIRAKLTALLLEIVGVSVGSDEPFMEVSSPV